MQDILNSLKTWTDDELVTAAQAVRHDAKFSTWMTRIVVNQCLMRLRQTRRAQFLSLDDTLIGENRGTLELVDRTESRTFRRCCGMCSCCAT